MALPTLTKSWQFQVNQQVLAQGSVAATNKRLMRTIKNAFLGGGSWTNSLGAPVTPTANWTVRGSGTPAASGMDLVDRWTVDSDLSWNDLPGDTKSWIVLRQTGIAAMFEICIQLLQTGTSAADAATQQALVAVSPAAGFGSVNGGTDGSTSARPTATDEFITTFDGSTVSTSRWGGSTSDVNTRWHMLKAGDGSVTRLILTRNNWVVGYWAFSKPDHPVTGWSNPSISTAIGAVTAAPTATLLTYANMAASSFTKGRGVSTMDLFFTGEGVRTGTALLGQRMATQNNLSGTYPAFKVGLFSSTASNRGRHGTVADLWWALSALVDTTTYPNDATHQFVQTGCFMQPWDRSVPNFV